MVMELVNQFTQSTELSILVTEENARLPKRNCRSCAMCFRSWATPRLDSGNSSRPPSSDGLTKSATKVPRTGSQRGTSNRKSGGRSVHKGTTLKQVENPDEVFEHYPNQCQGCQAGLSPDESIRSAARQVFDLAPISLHVVTEHCAYACR